MKEKNWCCFGRVLWETLLSTPQFYLIALVMYRTYSWALIFRSIVFPDTWQFIASNRNGRTITCILGCIRVNTAQNTVLSIQTYSIWVCRDHKNTGFWLAFGANTIWLFRVVLSIVQTYDVKIKPYLTWETNVVEAGIDLWTSYARIARTIR